MKEKCTPGIRFMIKEPFKVTVYAVIEKNGKILLSEDEDKPGWKLPGGEVEKGESIIEAVKREIKEEVGLRISITGVISLQEYIKEDGIHRLRMYFAAKPVGGQARPNPGEVKKVRWFSKGEINRLKKEDFFISQYYWAVRDYLSGKVYPRGLFRKIDSASIA